jgi:hypothetical protein
MTTRIDLKVGEGGFTFFVFLFYTMLYINVNEARG